MIKTYSVLLLFMVSFLFAQKNKTVTYAGTFSTKNTSFVVGKIYLTSVPKEVKKTEEEQTFSNYLSVYPNPVTDLLNIKDTSENTIIEEVCILTLDGKLVYRKRSATTTIDVSFLNEGIYIVKIQTNHYLNSYKIIKT